MKDQISFRGMLYSKAGRIIAGISLLAGWVVLVEAVAAANTATRTVRMNLLIGIIEITGALLLYTVIYRKIEKRKISELSIHGFLKYAGTGFFAGLISQSFIILVLFLTGNYTIIRVNPFSFLLPSFTTALTSGFVGELIIRGILFRITEEKAGTFIALVFMSILFAIMHLGGKGATVISILAVVSQAGFLLSAMFIFSRSLWFPIFFHIAWDFAEPGIFGTINPGNSIEKSLFTSQVSGPEILSGGSLGPVNSLQSMLLCFFAGSLFLWLASRKKNFIFPKGKNLKNE